MMNKMSTQKNSRQSVPCRYMELIASVYLEVWQPLYAGVCENALSTDKPRAKHE